MYNGVEKSIDAELRLQQKPVSDWTRAREGNLSSYRDQGPMGLAFAFLYPFVLFSVFKHPRAL